MFGYELPVVIRLNAGSQMTKTITCITYREHSYFTSLFVNSSLRMTLIGLQNFKLCSSDLSNTTARDCGS
jgi:hypothetical protein